MSKPTVAELRAFFSYDPVTGIFRWKKHRCRCFVGKKAGCLHKPTGYWFLSLHDFKIKGHIAAWAYMNMKGRWPTFHIDHKDLNKANNKYLNLRPANKSKNGANRPKQKNNTSGHKGVFWKKDSNFWLVQIKARGKLHYIGIYKQKEDAIAAYAKAAKRFHGEFARSA